MTRVETVAADTITGPDTRAPKIRVRWLGLVDYEPTWRAMQKMTAARTPETPDEIWVLEHPPVYTLGIAGRSEHLPRDPGSIPVIRIDRGGQITFHGPGQIVVYLLLDMRRRGLTVRPLVWMMEQAVIDLLAAHGIAADRRAGAPGVYINGAKIAALGLRVKNGCCYHGLAFNAEMDLKPFHAVDPCGYPGLAVTQARDLGIAGPTERLGGELVDHLLKQLS